MEIQVDITEFSTEQQKHLIQTLSGAWAFVPPLLPPQIAITPEIAMALAQTAMAIGELNGASRRLQNPYMLVNPLIRKEALTSSAMEGTFTTINNIILEEVEPSLSGNDDSREAYNYANALGRAEFMLENLPLSHRVIKHAHVMLLSGLSAQRGAGKKPGEYKTSQNAIGQIGDDVRSARYVPPPPAQTQNCMDDLEKFINREERLQGQKLLDLAVIHYQFEAIHPFNDGNGRMGRMIITLAAKQMGLIDLPILHVSSFLESRKNEYIEKLFAVSTKSEWEQWIVFFLFAIEQSSLAATKLVDRIINLQSELRELVKLRGKSKRLSLIVDELFSKGWTTATETHKNIGVTFKTAQADLKELVNLGILQENSTKHSIVYFAPQINKLSDRGLS